jgi:hypothetical protein
MSSNLFESSTNNNNIDRPTKMELVDKLKYMTLDGDVILEPRLQEYLKKKMYYKTHDVQPCISPEQEFQITSMDKKVLRDFLRGDKKIYNPERLEKYAPRQQKKRYFPSSSFKEDSRVPDIEKCMPKQTSTPINRGMFVPEKNERYYEIPSHTENKMLDSRDFPPFVYDGRGFDPNDNKFNPRIDPHIDTGIEKYDKYQSQYRIPPTPMSNPDPDPRNKYIISDLSKKPRSRKHEHGTNVDMSQFSEYDEMKTYKNYQLIDKNDRMSQDARYGNELAPSFNAASEMDLDNKVVIPNMASKSKKDLNCGNYRFESYYGKNICRNTDLESDLVRGMPTYRPHNRSYGYRNPAENYYDYIDDDFQNPDNSVEAWIRGGEATRLDNKNPTMNRVYNRPVM